MAKIVNQESSNRNTVEDLFSFPDKDKEQNDSARDILLGRENKK
ncbi:hypothetical protein [Leuconostoc palmae]|nr:hypothetical protein [Leuconostoc palmae]